MKKLILILLCLPLLFSTCKKEDEEPTNTGNNNTNNTGNTTATILGEWDLKKIEWETTIINQGSDNGTESGTEIFGGDNRFLYLEFYEDQQVKSTTWGEILLDNGNTYDGTKIEYGTWEIDFGDDLYITIPNLYLFDADDLGRPMKIDLLDNSRLQFTEQEYRYNGDQQGEGKFFFER